MSDIVKELRENAEIKSGEAWRRMDGGLDLCLGSNLADRAADEIERLRAALDVARTALLRIERRCEEGRAELTKLAAQ